MNENNLILNNTLSLQELEQDNENYTFINIAEKKYAIKTKNVLEIIKVIELDYPHQMPSYIIGLINFKEKPIGVIDLREIFQNERVVYPLSAKILIVRGEKTDTAIICDNVVDIKKMKINEIQEIPYQKQTNFFDGSFFDDEQNIYILNIENILDYCEKNQEKYAIENTQKYIINDENAKEILKTRKSFLSQNATNTEVSTTLYDRGVSFIINDAKYYINMASVKEFFKVNNSKFIKIPNTKDFIIGLINIKGEYVTVIDIRRFFYNSKTEIKEKSTIIILNSNEFKIGILTDEICESMNVDFEEIIQSRLQKQDEDKMIEFVKDNEIYQVLEIEKLLNDERLIVI